uniref:hypothetical protein n=1 Tax=uncultured Helicobacter sp. TaxID=175537 RepID=UPI0026039C4C
SGRNPPINNRSREPIPAQKQYLWRDMAKQNFREVQQQARQIMAELKKGNYAPIYLLMGEEGFYTDKISGYIAAYGVITEFDSTCGKVVYDIFNKAGL